LSEVLSHPAIWRGGDCAPEPAALPTGYSALDAVLPGGGWPQGALTEILLEREGIGELRLALPALSTLTREGRAVVWIAPPYRPYAPALAASGIDLARLIVVRGRDLRESLWAYEQALRAGRLRCRVRVARRARAARAASPPGRGTRRPHVGRAVAPSGPARERHGRAVAPRARTARRPARGARVEAARRGARAPGPPRRRPHAGRAADRIRALAPLRVRRRHACVAANRPSTAARARDPRTSRGVA
jgi:hypothetical protein